MALNFQGDSSSFVYKDSTNIVAKAVYGGANYTVTVDFEPLDDTGAASWNWDFGDGNTSTSRTPSHEYIDEGVHSVSLYIDGDTGTTVTKVSYIIVVRELSFNVVVDPPSWYESLPKTFDIGVTGATRTLDPVPASPYEAFSWDLGNGYTVGNVTGLQYSGYATQGIYVVEATVRDIGVSGIGYTKQSVSYSTQLVILGVSINVTPNTQYINTSVFYTATFSGVPPATIKWNFGDGSPVHTKYSPGSSYSVSHTFTTAGVFDATLILDEGFPTEATFSYSSLDPNLSELRVLVSDLSPNFDITPDTGKVPLTGIFTDTSIGSITGYEWDWGDGSSDVTQDSTFFHTYTGIGVFNPLMTVYDIYGFNASVSKPVTIYEALGINIYPTPGYAPQELWFTPVSDVSVVEWDWKIIYDDPSLGEVIVFSKNTTDPSEKIFIQRIDVPTTYRVRLVCTDAVGTEYTAEESLNITEDIGIYTNPPSGEAPLSVTFEVANTDPSTVDLIQWDFTNDSIVDSLEINPTYIYNSVGTYTVSLDLTWYLNEAETSLVVINKTSSITVGTPGLEIGMDASPSRGKAPLSVLFTGSANNAVSSWSWEIEGIGAVSSAQVFSYIFNTIGIYTITLTVVDSYSNTSSITRTITVTNSVSTSDSSIDPSDTEASVAIKTGPGSIIGLQEGGVKVSINRDSSEISATGFTRKKGPSLTFD